MNLKNILSIKIINNKSIETINNKTMEIINKKIKTTNENNNEVEVIKGIGIKEQRIFTQIDTKEMIFNGFTEIYFNSLPEKFINGEKFLSIDSKELEILSIKNNKKSINFEIDINNSKIILQEKISPVSILEISYKGIIKANMEGLYVSNYLHPDSKKEKKIFSTHFEPSYARQAFPCIDHPSVKTIFKISISAPKGLTVLSNSEIISNIEKYQEFEKIALSKDHIFNSEEYEITHFEDTPIMSTYLIAFVIGELEKLSKGRTEIYAPFKISDGNLALEVAEFSLKFYEKFFGVPYPLKKLKHVAIPEFSMGAMENWGLVTYRMTSLMHSQSSSIRLKQNMILTVAHEIAHQWFGNLVTMEWWDDLWLNEGFATWCEYHAIDYLVKNQGTEKDGLEIPQLNLKYDAWTQFILETTNPGLNLDSMNSSHPVHSHVSKVEDIEQLFDAIAYNKGSALIRMMHDYVGEAFSKNLKTYIETYKYSNAHKDNLFDSLDINSKDDKMNLTKIMRIWITQQGFPLLIVKEKGDKLEIKQTIFTNGVERSKEIKSIKEKFFLDLNSEECELNNKECKDNYNWPIPIKINWDGNIKDYLMIGKSIEIEKISENYVINDEKVGFFRVFYRNPEKQAKLKENKISNVVSFLIDYFSFTKNGYIGINKYLENIYFNDEFRYLFNNYYFLSEVFISLMDLKNIFPEKEEFFNDFIRNFIGIGINSIDIINFPLDEKFDDDIMLLNSLKVTIAIEIAKKSELKLIYNKLTEKKIEPVYLSSKYRIMMLYKDSYEEILDIAKNGELGEMVSAKLNLGASGKEETYKKAMNLLLTNEIKASDKLYLANSLLNNYKLRHIFCEFFFENYILIWEAYKKNSSLFSSLLERAIAVCEKPHWEGKKPFEGTESAFKKGLEKNQIKSLFRKNNLSYFGLK